MTYMRVIFMFSEWTPKAGLLPTPLPPSIPHYILCVALQYIDPYLCDYISEWGSPSSASGKHSGEFSHRIAAATPLHKPPSKHCDKLSWVQGGNLCDGLCDTPSPVMHTEPGNISPRDSSYSFGSVYRCRLVLGLRNT